MKGLLLALLFSPSLTWAARPEPCALYDVEPCTPSEKEKQEIRDSVEQGLKVYAEGREAWINYKRFKEVCDSIIKCGLNEHEEMLKELAIAKSNEGTMKFYFGEAISKSAEYYRIKPAIAPNSMGSISVPVKKPIDPEGRGAWVAGVKALWFPGELNVGFSVADKDGEPLAHKIAGNDGRAHYEGGVLGGGGLAMTLNDGAVFISREAFQAVSETGNPGKLAAILYHESRHFNEITQRGAHSKELSEWRAWRDTAKVADAFDVDDEDEAHFIVMRDVYADSLARIRKHEKGSNYVSTFPSPESEAALKKIYSTRVDLDKEYQTLSDQVRREVLERQAAEQRRREEETQKQRETEASAWARFEELVADYQFRLCEIGRPYGPYGRYRFQDISQNSSSGCGQFDSYNFKLRTLDDAQPALFLARTCLDNQLAAPSQEAIDILFRRLGDPEFRERMASDHNDSTQCVRFLLNNYASLTTADGIKGTLAAERQWDAYWSKRRKEVEAQAKDIAERNQRIEEKVRRNQERQGNRGGNGNDHGIDLKPPQDVLDRLRGR